ncbi:AMP-activated serine/threonine-protein kinase regulatory subunit SNF4 [Sugiyamaella lignohabitans]|uniref:5'-AMP-activated protein kinase subunit gamma n=1 Tax=Sugiyamaella lignohabitans TaxID=796027 RepID=A0A167FDM5_9ASCO|nr:AMP-activated serine/threonine-protein kinase regulatory subunit SNF4 [Sugiyamaella lignohabitans]ANB15165.1 AMP-activated serine/threonine-protein kinase regulatory subunit SNF4 [Sugiyamaella lignohabitans]
MAEPQIFDEPVRPGSPEITTVVAAPGLGDNTHSAPSDQIAIDQKNALISIRAFLKSKTAYDVLPVSFRLIVLDTALLVKKSLTILLQNSIVSAPLWNSRTSRFAGLLTASDYINVIQYYFQNPDKMDKIEDFTLDGLRTVEKAIGAEPIETISIHPFRPLYEACGKMISSKARRIPLIDVDEDSGREIVVSVLTQYRILKFVALNCKETTMLMKPLRDLNIGVRGNLATVSMQSPVIDVIHILASKRVSSVPIVDDEYKLINIYESYDVLALIKGGIYTDLSLSVGEALMRRADDFEGVHTCTDDDRLDTIMDIIRRSRLHRLFVVDEQGVLKGIVTLSDILNYILYGEEATS